MDAIDTDVLIVFGSIVVIVFLGILGSIVKTWIRSNSPANLSENREFLDALREFKEDMEYRMSNLEAIAADDHPVQTSAGSSTEDKSVKTAVELELNDSEPQQTEERSTPSKLRNMLNQ